MLQQVRKSTLLLQRSCSVSSSHMGSQPSPTLVWGLLPPIVASVVLELHLVHIHSGKCSHIKSKSIQETCRYEPLKRK